MELKNFKYLVGIDEVGRGAIAGPVAVGVVVFYGKNSQKHFMGVRDSKQLTPEERERWFLRIREAKKDGFLDFSVSFSAHTVVDSKGIVPAIQGALMNALKKFSHYDPSAVKILLDGGLKAPAKYQNQKTIIKGDEKECTIALASIAAKVLRDRKMVEWGKHLPMYGFERHKGYGTKLHYKNLKQYGVSKIHRRSFIKT